jgi:hypothetical protein
MVTTRWLSLVVLAAVLVPASNVSAQPAAPKPKPAPAPAKNPTVPPPAATKTAAPAPAPSDACPNGRTSALSELACELGRALGKVPAGAVVVSAPLAGDSKPTTPAELTTRITSILAGTLGSKSSSEVATLSRARTIASTSGTLVFVQSELAKGELRVSADIYPVPRSFWDRVRDPEPNPTQHAFATRRIDAELRGFFPPVPLVAKRTDKATSSEPNPLAIACGDINGDGSLELVLVGRVRVQMGRIRAGRFAPLATASWTQLSPLSRAPLREPIASAWIEGGRWVDVGSTDRLDAVRLDASFGSPLKLGHRLPWPAGGCSKIQGVSVRPEIEACSAGDAAPALERMEKPADALAGAIVVGKNGKARTIRAERAFNEATVIVRDDTGRRALLEGSGAQLAIGDLDGDGQPEIVSSADTLEASGDAVIVHTWQEDGKLVERMRVAVPSGVRAIGVCPPESVGLAPIALATSGEIWILR